jgi:serine phosphatase RsbU (regulator of sigma subunit)
LEIYQNPISPTNSFNELLLFFTDGFTEAFDAQGRSFSRGRLAKVLQQSASGGPDSIIGRIRDHFEDFTGVTGVTGEVGQQDDQTLLVLQLVGQKS